MSRDISLLSGIFVVSGILHFAKPEPYEAIVPGQNLTERNGPRAPGAKLSTSLNVGKHLDGIPQKVLDRILWRSVKGRDSSPPPPGPNASDDNTYVEKPRR